VDARSREHTPRSIEGKSFDSTGSMRRTPKLSQELKTAKKNSKERVIELEVKWARDTEMPKTDLKMWRKAIGDCFRKRAM
jgi:hypothetical protein